MFRLYVNTLTIFLGLSNFVVLASAWGNGRDVTARDLIVPAGLLFLLVSSVFAVLKLFRLRDSRMIARALAEQRAQIAHFKTALSRQAADGPEFSKGIKSWNSYSVTCRPLEDTCSETAVTIL